MSSSGRIFYGGSVDPNAYGAVGDGVADDSTALNAALASTSAGAVVTLEPGKTYAVGSSVILPSAAVLNLNGAKLLQKKPAPFAMVKPASGSAIVNGQLIGLGTDYVPGQASPQAIGVDINGATRVRMSDLFLGNVAGAAVRFTSALSCTWDNVEVAGVAAYGTTISALDNACYGFYIGGGCSRLAGERTHIHDSSIGLIQSLDNSYLQLTDTDVHDIPGQHGIYLQCDTGLVVQGADLRNINLNGVKLQMGALFSSDLLGSHFQSINAENCGDVGLSINNTDPALTYKHRNVVVDGLTASGCGRAFYIGSVRGGSVGQIEAFNTLHAAITVLDTQDVEFWSLASETSGEQGLFVSSVANGSNQRLTFRDTRVDNAANANVANTQYGVHVGQGSDITLDELRVTASNGTMTYGLFNSDAVGQPSMAVRNAKLSGDTGTSARLAAGPVALGEWRNNVLSGSALFFPTSLPIPGDGLAGSDLVATAAPTSGTWPAGKRCRNSAPAVGTPKAWVCTAAGTPGTWVSEGNL